MKTRGTTKSGKAGTRTPDLHGDRRLSHAAYGDRVPICSNTGCVMRKQAACFGFEGCPGFKAKG